MARSDQTGMGENASLIKLVISMNFIFMPKILRVCQIMQAMHVCCMHIPCVTSTVGLVLESLWSLATTL